LRILLIEDDAALQLSLQRALQKNHWRVEVCSDGWAALDVWKQFHPDVVLLDLNLPGRDGLELLSAARQSGLHQPVIILTARGTVGDRVIGLNSGADDYLAKPFDLDELEARIKALRRRELRGEDEPSTEREFHQIGRLRVSKTHADQAAAHVDAEVLDLTPRERALLAALCQRPGTAVTKERLVAWVFASETQVSDDALEVVVYRLRKKLVGSDATIMTLRGLGYLIKAVN
jgi:two-component system response regulator TctD